MNGHELTRLAEEIRTLQTDLATRQAVAEKHLRSFRIAAIVLCVVIAGYLSFLTALVQARLSPEALVTTARHVVLKNMPGVVLQFRRSLTASAPDFAKTVIAEGLKAVPTLRLKAQENIDQAVAAYLEDIRKVFPHAFQAVVLQHEGALKAISRLNDGEIYALAHELMDGLVKEMHLAGATPAALAQAEQDLWRMQHELEALRQPNERLTEDQRLEKRFLELLIQAINQETATLAKGIPLS